VGDPPRCSRDTSLSTKVGTKIRRPVTVDQSVEFACRQKATELFRHWCYVVLPYLRTSVPPYLRRCSSQCMSCGTGASICTSPARSGLCTTHAQRFEEARSIFREVSVMAILSKRCPIPKGYRDRAGAATVQMGHKPCSHARWK
jgi:hypothetical protein